MARAIRLSNRRQFYRHWLRVGRSLAANTADGTECVPLGEWNHNKDRSVDDLSAELLFKDFAGTAFQLASKAGVAGGQI